MADQRVRITPSVSVESLGLYLVSPPLRRRSIIEREKYPSSFTNYYDPAREAIEDFLVGCCDRMGLLCSMERLVEGPHETTYAQHRANDCALAVLRFLEQRLSLPAMTVSRPARPNFELHGITVRGAADVFLGGPEQCDGPSTGAVKLVFSKIGFAPLHAVALLLSSLVGERCGTVCLGACYAVDVFAGAVATAAEAKPKTRKDIEAACDEIRRSWSTI